MLCFDFSLEVFGLAFHLLRLRGEIHRGNKGQKSKINSDFHKEKLVGDEGFEPPTHCV